MADNTEDNKVEDPVVEDTKIIVGDREFSQDELSQLVGLGEQARELETKWNTKVDRLMPEFTKATQEKKTLEERIKELEAQPVKTEPQQGDLTPEQVEQARTQLEKITGGKIVTQENFDKAVQQVVVQQLAAKDLLEDVKSVVVEADTEGTPKTTPEDLLRHMEETGIRNPKKAYKDMFETELDKIKEQKLGSIKPSAIQTVTGGAGAKTPEPVRVTKENLGQLLRDQLVK